MTQPLTQLTVGQEAEVTAITSRIERRLAHLSAFGIVPGCRVRLNQRHFAYVVMVGETEIALDTDVAREIMVRVG
jgi:DtxR family Mn-dependent transcriptional regulator